MTSPTFYVATTLGERTAGPEALTQFVDALRRRGQEAYLIAMRNFRGRRNDPEYDIYDFSVADRIRDPQNSIFVLSEVSPIESYRELREVPRERTWMGWFSVNNSPDPRARYYRPSERTGSTFPPSHVPARTPVPADLGLQTAPTGPLRHWKDARRRTEGSGRGIRGAAVEALSIAYAQGVVDSPLRFFAQSYYAQGFCREILGRPAPIITDPLRVVTPPDVPRQRALVVYNGTKGWSLVPELERRLPDVEFRSLSGMPYTEVVRHLSEATLYAELGHLPGRDRLPREAAHYGACVVMLTRGSGYLWADSPLPVQDRIELREGWPDEMAAAIRSVIEDPEGAAARQQGYREWVAGERERYESAMDAWVETALTS
jgi:hypothetical protein